MKTDIYGCLEQRRYRFIAVPAGNPVPECWAGCHCRFFKTIDLLPGQSRIGMASDADTVLSTIDEVGWAVM